MHGVKRVSMSRPSHCPWLAGAAVLAAWAAGCEPRVPLTDVGAAFTIADLTWVGSEQTLFVFYRVDALQGLSEASQLELAFTTDEHVQEFAPLASFAQIHPHVAVSCGPATLCGSASIRVEQPPRQAGLRLRYHKEGEMTLDAEPALHVLELPERYRGSALVYGVLTEDNTRIQWRLRHQFPALRNEEVEALGLRRAFRVSDAAHGSLDPARVEGFIAGGNPYGFGSSDCPGVSQPLDWQPVLTEERAIFQPEELPRAASTSAHVCATAELIDANGTFTAVAIAQKNPEVRPAFPALRTPARIATPLRFLLQTCDAIISEEHRQMQMQRLFLSDADAICLDDIAPARLTDELVRALQTRVDGARAGGEDMILMIALQRPDDATSLAGSLEQALIRLAAAEENKSSPRAVGAFVFDSAGRRSVPRRLARFALWCPSSSASDDLDAPDLAARDCALAPEQELVLGPLRLEGLPILPTRRQYDTFLGRYGEARAGRVRELTVRAPTRTPTSTLVDVEGFGVATFFDEERLSTPPGSAFSFCANGEPTVVVFRASERPDVRALFELPDAHNRSAASSYELGVLWDMPWYLHLKYEAFLTAAATIVGVTIPFGPAVPGEQYLGGEQWTRDSFDLSQTLLLCSRFCEHPTFDSAGIYNVLNAFRTTFANFCYAPQFPKPGDGGFPHDP